MYVPPSPADYVAFYLDHGGGHNQRGGIIPYYKGAGIQKGHGLGSMLGSLFRSAAPMLKSAAKTIGKQALDFGVGLAKDAMGGRDLREAAKERALEGGANILDSITGQSGHQRQQKPPANVFNAASSTRKNTNKRQARAQSTQRKRKRRRRDVFD